MVNSVNYPIIYGDRFWSDSVLDGLCSVTINSKSYETYKDAPISLYDSLVNSKNRLPNKCCIIDDLGTSYSYQQFFDLVEEFSRFLFHHYHAKPGSHIGLLLYNSIEFCVACYAINKLGAVAVPLSTKYKKTEILSLMERADLSGLIYDNDFSEWFNVDNSRITKDFTLSIKKSFTQYALPDGSSCPDFPEYRQSPEDIAIIMFTSGTTSKSKGVQIANFNITHAMTVYKKVFQISEADKTVIPIPLYHVTGLIAVLGVFILSGGCIYIHKFFNAPRVLADIKEYGITFLHASPTVFSLLLERREEYPELPTLNIIACGSSNMPKRKIQEWNQWLPNTEFHTVYGLTETASPATIFPTDAAHSIYIGSSGHPIPGTQFKICDDDGNVLPFNQIGSIMIKGTVITPGYYKFSGSVQKDNWFDTGDLGYFNESGYLFIVDRKKDMINRGGEKICSFDVENVLYNIPGIAEAAVVGIPDDIYGEVPAAMIALESGIALTPDDIRESLQNKLARFQIPVKFLIADSLPVTQNLKVDKNKIRQLLS